jgi:four helix bundle protein
MNERPHRNLIAWKKSLELAREIYKVTTTFPKSEEYGLKSQMRRAAVSIPSNLAEGAARKGSKEFKQFFNIIQGSLSELDTQIEFSKMLNYIENDVYESTMTKMTEISEMLYGLAKNNKITVNK